MEKSVDQLQQQYKYTIYKDQVKVFCSDQRRQLINRRLLPAVERVKKHEEWKKEDTENLERKLNQLMYLYRKSEQLNDVLLLCMELRSQISWNRLQYSKEEPFLTKRSELNRKLRDVEQLVQQAKAGTKEITEAEKAIDVVELQYSITEYTKHVSMLCDVKRTQLNHLYSDEGLMRTEDRELNSRVDHVERLVQQAKGGTEQKIREAEEEISRLELKYFTTKYSGRVSLFCTTKRAEMFWYRLPHSDKEQIMTVNIEGESSRYQAP
ncbi:uncharacterized protein LOC125145487 [Tachysurus fulvidraco]|uniref:uncharacterized protein LOC125145487 n=1 Tax=Tachysurus fulvidraco TaxID=1234273 RepID=UPI001FEEF77E|nr:uncharacterized protein LOC125145487 [Tachysurus fulvidraco]